MNANSTNIFSNGISDTLSTAIIVLDKSLLILQMNAAAENMFGQSRERILQKSYDSLFSDKQMKKHLSFVLDNEETQTLRGCHLKGQYHENILVDCVASPILKTGVLEGVVLELYRTEHHQRIAREHQLHKQQEATQTLVRGLAHEIKNPLGGLRGAAQLLDSELDNNNLKEYTRIIMLEADRLKSLVDRMLGSSQPTKNEAVNIHEVLERVRKLVRADIPDNVNLRFDYDPSIPELLADRDHLVQIIFNIVGNALKAVGESGNILFKTRVLRNFTINQRKHRLVLRLEITDDGKGIPDDIQDKLFYPMISGFSEGTGLGLSIAQSLANRHKGVIEFESRAGKTCFILLLPILSHNIEVLNELKKESENG